MRTHTKFLAVLFVATLAALSVLGLGCGKKDSGSSSNGQTNFFPSINVN